MANERKQILQLKDAIYGEMKRRYSYEDVDPGELKATHMDIVRFLVNTCPESYGYGTAFGLFVYQDERVFEFHYNIHTPPSKGPVLSNTMTNLEQVRLKEKDSIPYVINTDTSFGAKAFWKHTPTDCLDEEDRSIRELMESVASYCQKEDLCAKLRKLDRKHEKWKIRLKALLLQQNTLYGVTAASGRKR